LPLSGRNHQHDEELKAVRINQIVVDNLLSFDHAELDLDPRWTTVVGPNGSGKTNLLRLLALAESALAAVEEGMVRPTQSSSASTVLAAYAGQRHRHASDRAPRIEIALELTSDEEREQLTCFIQAAIASALWDRIQRSDVFLRLADWAAGIRPDQVRSLFQGSLVL
jgi:ABC-type transport system involved in cytochrome c biogenesis ATPase subunit